MSTVKISVYGEPSDVTSAKLKFWHEMREKLGASRSVIVNALRTAAEQYDADAQLVREDMVRMGHEPEGMVRVVKQFETQSAEAREILWYLEL